MQVMGAKTSQEMNRACELVTVAGVPIRKAAEVAGVHWASLYRALNDRKSLKQKRNKKIAK